MILDSLGRYSQKVFGQIHWNFESKATKSSRFELLEASISQKSPRNTWYSIQFLSSYKNSIIFQHFRLSEGRWCQTCLFLLQCSLSNEHFKQPSSRSHQRCSNYGSCYKPDQYWTILSLFRYCCKQVINDKIIWQYNI